MTRARLRPITLLVGEPAGPRVFPWERVATRLAAAIAAGLIDPSTGRIQARTCACRACVHAETVLDDLREPEIRPHTEAMIRHAVAYCRLLRRAYTLAGSTLDLEIDRLAMEGARLLDEIGVVLAGTVRRAVLQDFAMTDEDA